MMNFGKRRLKMIGHVSKSLQYFEMFSRFVTVCRDNLEKIKWEHIEHL